MSIFSEECRTFLLKGTKTGKLATVRADGRPHVVPIWYDLDGDTLIFTTWHTTIKANNIRRDNRVSICVDDDTPPFAFALIDGTATFSDDLQDLAHWAAQLGGRYMGQDQAEAYGKRNGVAGELVVRVTPTKVTFQADVAN